MASPEVSWWQYARSYDVLCDHNPYYQQNLEQFSTWLSELELDANPDICEVGAGTGNFLNLAAELRPDASFYHWDWNSTMNAIARQKYDNSQIQVEIQNNNISEFPGDLPRQDVMLAFNALYTFPDGFRVLEEVFQLLKPGGWFYTVDIGRPLEVGNWLIDLVSHNIKSIGFSKTMSVLLKSRFAITANRQINDEGDSGQYWRHETSEFGDWLEDAGFEVVLLERCYRDSADRAICRKPLTN